MSLEKIRALDGTLDADGLFRRVMSSISRSQSLVEIFKATTAEVGEFLKVDRVKIYKFNPDRSGQVVAEWIRDQQLPSLAGLHFPADDIPDEARELFIQAKARVIADVANQRLGQSFLRAIDGTVKFDDIRYRPVDPCHIEYLTAMGVQASLVVPILHHEDLWGLFVAHHSQPRDVDATELQIVQMIVDLLGVAIAQSTLTAEIQAQADREAALNQISRLLHSLSTIELQAALEEAIAAFDGSGGRLWVYAESLDPGPPTIKDARLPSCCVRLYKAGSQPILAENAPFALMEQYGVWQDRFQSEQDSLWAIADLYQEPKLRTLQPAFRATKIRGMMMIPLWYRQQLLGYLSIFRDEIETEILWAGRVNPDERQLYPRESFEAWKESRSGQTMPWTKTDLELAQALGQQFATAIQQYESHQQLQALNASLEVQVKDRTAQLEDVTEQQRILFEVVTNMRKSLNLETIFATVTQELRRSLSVDRVGIYRFNLNSDYNEGEFIAEDVLPEFPSALAMKIQDPCFANEYLTKYRLGRVNAIADIHATGLKACHVEMLTQFAIKASITTPLMNGNTLWGLLCIHQCDRSREWHDSEIQFVSQVAAQLGIGLEQAELLAQTQQQAEQLSQALHTLKTTQSQLIQTEKMSSLGQLVAGVAHEINNPVNFIYGNLKHLDGYVNDLLELVKTYEMSYPNPTAEVVEQTDAIDLAFLSEDLPKTLASMQLGTDRIRQIVLSLRNFSRLDQSEMKSVDIHEGLDSTLLILQHRFKAKIGSAGIELVKEYGDLPLVECYAGQLNQVFMNLLSNAIDALEESNPDAALIRISTEQLENRVVIRITDNGMGIPAELQAQVFEPFFTTKPIGKGTGMGLSISREIVVDKHGGEFKCFSEPGTGTQFWIEIPIRQEKCGSAK